MSENYNAGGSGEKYTFRQKLENFFYHYKWHTIVAVFLVITIVICSVQMCSKPSYDVYVMYAGGHDVKKTASDGDVSEYQKVISTIMQKTEDFDKDGNRNVGFLTLFLPSAEQIAEVERGDSDLEISYSAVSENTEIFEQNMSFGEYSICLLSEELFLEWCEKDGIQLFAEIEEYTDEDYDGYEYLNKYGIRLSSTPIYETAGMQILPEDTVVCIRLLNNLSSKFNSEKNREYYSRSEEVLRRLLAE